MPADPIQAGVDLWLLPWIGGFAKSPHLLLTIPGLSFNLVKNWLAEPKLKQNKEKLVEGPNSCTISNHKFARYLLFRWCTTK